MNTQSFSLSCCTYISASCVCVLLYFMSAREDTPFSSLTFLLFPLLSPFLCFFLFFSLPCRFSFHQHSSGSLSTLMCRVSVWLVSSLLSALFVDSFETFPMVPKSQGTNTTQYIPIIAYLAHSTL